MKHGSIKVVCLVVMAFITVLSAYGDDRTIDLESIVLEDFGNVTTHEWNDGRHPRNLEFSWGLAASKFATKSKDEGGNQVNYPVMAYVDTWPIALYGYNREGRSIKSLGIHGRFDRRGFNWIDLHPVGADGAAFEIPMPGRVRYIDMWAWGSNLDYLVEAYVRDFQGVVHIIKLGSLAYTGWRNLRANIPGYIHQSKRVLPNLAQLRFIKFRIWTQPSENVDNFYIYLKQFKVLTDVFESTFDGDELADPDLVPQLWANGGNSRATN
ncbi:MAG: flagellar filament outer layer protein FlaA [Treponema sp.]|jgi:hypothetical protein|nr:flagellar filament outer layer protein FlaA [Treponema sp.]